MQARRCQLCATQWLWPHIVPSLTSRSVIVCHLFMATYHVLPFLRQLRSITSLDLSPFRVSSMLWRRSIEKVASGKRYDVMITYRVYSAKGPDIRLCADCIWIITFSAPLEIHSAALMAVIPPPTCKPPFQAVRALSAAASLPGPSMMT